MTSFSDSVDHIVMLYEALEAERDRLTSENERLSQELHCQLNQQPVAACLENLQLEPALQSSGMHSEKAPDAENSDLPTQDNASAEQEIPRSVTFESTIVVEDSCLSEKSCLSEDFQNPRQREDLHHSSTSMTIESDMSNFTQGSHSLAELKQSDLKQMFRHICTHLDLDPYIEHSKLKSCVSPRALAEMCMKHDKLARCLNDIDPEELERSVTDRAGKYAQALRKLQQSLHLSSSSATSGGLNFGTFKALVTSQEQELSEHVDESDLEELQSLRNCLIKESVSGVISEATRVDHHDLFHFLIENDAKWIVALEAAISMVILANAIIMGVNVDIRPDWIGWTFIEFGFTLIFCMELVVKLLISRNRHSSFRAGLRAHFFGKDSWMNSFDAVVVVFSILDLISTAVGQASGLGNISIARLTRLARLARLGKVLRFRIFKNLLLLLNGAVWGLRILFWALILLIFVVYFFGLLLRQTIGLSFDENRCSYIGECRFASETILDSDAKYLFGSVPRAMWTVFRCITGDCTTSGGQPISAHLANTHGVVFVITYVLCIVFVTFGLFNLIMAIFVENTLEYAKYDDTRRRELRHSEHVRTAQMLERLMMKFVVEVDHEAGTDVGRRPSALFSRWDTAEAQAKKMQVKISLQTFERVLLDKDVQRMLDDLDIPLNSRRKLFDTLDADGNGTLSIRELATGIVKLRGPADKTDIISVLLISQRMQEIVHNIELEVHHLRDSFKKTWGVARGSGGHSMSTGTATSASGSLSVRCKPSPSYTQAKQAVCNEADKDPGCASPKKVAASSAEFARAQYTL